MTPSITPDVVFPDCAHLGGQRHHRALDGTVAIMSALETIGTVTAADLDGVVEVLASLNNEPRLAAFEHDLRQR